MITLIINEQVIASCCIISLQISSSSNYSAYIFHFFLPPAEFNRTNYSCFESPLIFFSTYLPQLKDR